MPEIAETYALPVILSFRDTAKQAEKELGGALGGIARKSGRDTAKQMAAGVKAGEADVKRALDGYEKLYNKHADTLGNVKKAQAALNEAQKKGNDARIVAATERLEKAKRDEARALRIATDAHKDYQKAVKDSAQAAEEGGKAAGGGFLSGLSGAITGAGSSGADAASSFAAGFAGSSALLRLGSAGGPIGLALAAAGVVGGGLLAKNVLAGVEREVGTDLVQARLGIDEASMARVADAAGKAYVNNFGDSVQSNMGAVQSAIESGLLTGADDPAAQKVIEDLSTISALLGEEIPRVSRSASQLIRTGMAQDMTEAFDLIVKGQQAGLNVSEDWLDTLDEYSTQFRKLGLSGEEAMGLLSQMVKGGARDTDVAADALKEFSIRVVDGSELTRTAFTAIGVDADAMAAKFAEGGPAAAEAFDLTVDAIRGIEDPLSRSQVAVALFGTQAEDLGGALDHLDLSNAVDQLGEVEGATQRASDTLGDSPAAAIESARRSIEQSLTGVQDSLALAFGPGLATLASEVTEHTDDIKGAFVFIADAVLALGQDALLSFGQITEAFGDVLNVVGDTAGGVVKALATVDRFLHGETDNNRQMFEDAEMLFNLGEGARDTGRKMQGLADELGTLREEFRESTSKGDHLGDSVGGIGSAAGTSVGKVNNLKEALDKLPQNPPWWATPPTGTPPGTQPGTLPGMPALPNIAPPSTPDGPGFTIGGAPGPPTSGGGRGPVLTPPPLNAGAGSQGWWSTASSAGSSSGGTRKVGSDSGLLPQTIAVKDQISTQFGAITDIGGWRPPDGFNEHSSGRAIDVMIPNWNTPQGKAYGDQVTATALQNPNVKYVLWQQTQWNSDGTSKPMSDRGSPTQNHFDHAHIYTYENAGQHPTGAPVSKSTGSITLPAGSSPATTPSMVNAFGAGYEPGFGTPGVNEYGEPGYYETDPRRIAQAERSAEDSLRRIEDADKTVIDTNADLADAIAERDRIAKMTPVQRALAKVDLDEANAEVDRLQDQLERAKLDAERSREDAQWAQEDLTEAQRGDFKAAREAKKPKGAKGGMGGGGLGELGSIAGSFFKETFGFGDWLPDLANLWPVQAMDTIMNSVVASMEGLASGEWQLNPNGLPLMLPTDGEAATSGGPFGMPNVQAPPMPPPGQHGGSGMAPGPGPNITIDQSIHGNVGSDPAQVERERGAGLARAFTRIPIGS